jgi:outer membrane protein assembly factor BamB
VLCLDAAKGGINWSYDYDCPYDVQYPAGPRASPLIADGKVYTLGTEGNLVCLNAKDGKFNWSHEFKKELNVDSPVWGFAASPLLDGNKLICLARGHGSTVIAYDKDSGKEIWRALDAHEPGYCPPVIYELTGKRQLIVWHPEAINGLDPETGTLYWSQKFTAKAGLSVSMPRKLKLSDGSDGLFITSFYNGSMLLKFTADKVQPSVVWRGKSISEKNTDGLHSIIPTPFIEDGHIYGVCSYGQFRCLKAETGERVWESFIPTGGPYEKPEGVRWANAFIVKNDGRFFLPNEKGDLLIAKLSPNGYEELNRAHILEPTNKAAGRPVVWSHPAFANKCMVARNDQEVVCVSLAK